MKTVVRLAVLLLAVTAMCQARLALAEDFHWASGGSQATTLVGNEKAAAAADKSGCLGCCESCDPCCECDCCDPSFGLVGVFGFDAFKGVSDGFWPSNFGVVAGFNSGMLVPGSLGERGLAFQFGLTYGLYDWDGRPIFRAADSQQQTFVTAGLFRKADGDGRISFGMVYDWMFNSAWGEYAVNPTLGQWRGQVEYAFSDMNGLGIYGSVRDRFATTVVPGIGNVTNRPITQVNFFWHHKFESTAESWLWVGIPEQDRLNGQGSLGDWIIGASMQAPISNRLALYGNVQYMHPSAIAAPNSAASGESTWNVGAGIAWYFGGYARTSKLNGARWLPYMPVANNSTFLVDQNPF